MAFIPNNNSNLGMFIPTSVILDAQRIQDMDVTSADYQQAQVRLYQAFNNASLAINAREIGYYPTEEFVVGNLYYNPDSTKLSDFRPIFRTTVNTGALGPLGPGVNNRPHGLTPVATWQFVHIYGVACNTGTLAYWPMPNSSITVSVDATNIVITNASGVVFDVSSIVLEYSKT